MIVTPVLFAVAEGGNLAEMIPAMVSFLGIQFAVFIGFMAFVWMGFWLL